MKRSELDEQQLEDLLREMPKIRDYRDPRDVYQQITLKLQRRKKRSWVFPSLATAAAILLFVVLAPNLLNWNQSASDSVEESTASEPEQIEMARMEENNAEIYQEQEMRTFDTSDEKENIGMTMLDAPNYTAIYETDIEDEYVFTFIIPDHGVQNLVPITVVVPKEETKEMLEQFNETMPRLKEEEWGLTDYYPLNAELSITEEDHTLSVNLPREHTYGAGSASENTFIHSIREAAHTMGLEKIMFFTDNEPGAELGNHGYVSDLPINDKRNYAYYFYFPFDNSEVPYLVPYLEPFDDIREALEAMEEDIEANHLKASIPVDLDIEMIPTQDEEVLSLEISDEAPLENDSALIYTIEAILLTAKEFQYERVKIAYHEDEGIGKFTFNEEWEVPLAPNKIELMP